MAIVWYNEKPKNGIATFTLGNITLNKTAVDLIDTAYEVMLGLDKENKTVVIKPLTKAEVLRGDIDGNLRYKITIRSSYGRITNKSFILDIAKEFGFDFLVPKKFSTSWDDKHAVLIVRLKEESHD